MRSAYELQTASRVKHSEVDPLWKLLWKWNGHGRIKVFMWIVTHNNFMTNANIADHPYCHHCNMNMETVLHALRDCHLAQNVWNSLVNCGDKKEFYYATLSSWMIQQLLLTQDDELQFELNYGRVITGPELAWSFKIRKLIT